jgi:type VI secretion system FHA domain protein
VVSNAIPDDWDLDLPGASGAAPPRPTHGPEDGHLAGGGPTAPPPPATAERPYGPDDLVPPAPVPRPAPFGDTAPGPVERGPIGRAPPPPPPPPQRDGFARHPAAAAPGSEAEAAPPPPARPAAAPAEADGEGLIAAFLAGAGLPDLIRRSNVPPEQLMRGLGAAFRAFVEGLREVLITRASIKSEFRIEQTIIAARGNNPLKFSPSVEDALAAMLGESRGAFMDAEGAVRDSLDDIKRHEMATMEAMQAGLRAVLGQLDPAKLREEAEAAGGLSLVPAQRRARAFDLFEQRFAAVLRDAENTTDGVFARAFARAYEAASTRG